MTTKPALPVHVERIGPTLAPDRSRVLMRPFNPAAESSARRIVAQVMALPEADIPRLLGEVLGEFGRRHDALERYFEKRYQQVRPLLDDVGFLPKPLSAAALDGWLRARSVL